MPLAELSLPWSGHVLTFIQLLAATPEEGLAAGLVFSWTVGQNTENKRAPKPDPGHQLPLRLTHFGYCLFCFKTGSFYVA